MPMRLEIGVAQSGGWIKGAQSQQEVVNFQTRLKMIARIVAGAVYADAFVNHYISLSVAQREHIIENFVFQTQHQIITMLRNTFFLFCNIVD